jgi:hypothetical protein
MLISLTGSQAADPAIGFGEVIYIGQTPMCPICVI